MSQRYPCPNPVCTHEFEPAQLVGVAGVICPKCGMAIQLQPNSAPIAGQVTANPPAGVPMARAVANVPVASPVTTQAPMARPVQANAGPPRAQPVNVSAGPPIAQAPPAQPHQAAQPGAMIVRARNLPKSNDWITYSLVIGGFLLIVALGLVGIMVWSNGISNGGLLGGNAYKNSDFNFSLQKRPGWEEDRALKEKFGVRMLAQQRANPTAYMALDTLDPKDRTPSVREMDAQARKLLGNYFKKTLEADPMKDGEVAGEKANWFAFFGENDEIAARGEVYFFADQGIGYWIYTWAAEGDYKGLQSDFAELRNGFAILGKRDKWEQVQSRQIVLTGAKVKNYQLVDTTGRWEKEADSELDAYDPKADLALKADDPNSKIKSLGANLVVMVLDNAPDAVAAAKAHILAKHKREGYPATRISDVEGELPKDRVGESKGHLLKWRISNGDGRERYALVGIVPRAKDMLVIYAEAPWERRFTWEEAFQRIVESVQMKE
jgi:hypothetical protein